MNSGIKTLMREMTQVCHLHPWLITGSKSHQTDNNTHGKIQQQHIFMTRH